MLISIVAPVHNEADNIGGLVHEIASTMVAYCRNETSHEFEILIVDDGSDDGTSEVLQQACRELDGLRVVRHQLCCGQSTALRTAVAFACGDIIVTLDGDGQNDPADIPHLLEIMTLGVDHEPVDMVVGNRSRKRRDTRWRRISSRIANGVRRRVLRDETPDTGCGLKAARRDLLLELPYFDHMHRFLPALVRRAGGRVVSTPVNHRPRVRGRSHYGTWDRLLAGIIDMVGVYWLLRRAKLPEAKEWHADELRNNLVDDRPAGATVVHGTIRRAVA